MNRDTPVSPYGDRDRRGSFATEWGGRGHGFKDFLTKHRSNFKRLLPSPTIPTL